MQLPGTNNCECAMQFLKTKMLDDQSAINISLTKGSCQMMLRVRVGEHLQHGCIMMRHDQNKNTVARSNEMQRFQAMFGTSPNICQLL